MHVLHRSIETTGLSGHLQMPPLANLSHARLNLEATEIRNENRMGIVLSRA